MAVEFNRKCALWYGEKNGMNVNDSMSDDELFEVVQDEIGEQEDSCDNCDHPIQDDDVTCWFCGDDVSFDDTGGFDNMKEKKSEKKEKKSDKKSDKKEKS